ncbi:uncharacterized protein [Diadema antillarum]|uniref:uncharacterized protein n=1 Tax=Diadema antillarum TaxID=105358 RepID=UPI003A8A4FAE
MLKSDVWKGKRERLKKSSSSRSRRQNGSSFQSAIQTRSIERVLAPIAAQVSQLIILNETVERDGGKLPNLIPFAQTVLRATEDLVQVGQKMTKDTDDEKLQLEMPEVCDATIAAGRSMLMAVQRLQAEPQSEAARDNMVTAARRLLETTMKVLLISDDAEVRRIIDACQWVQDGLQDMRAVGSMKELVKCFKDFSESVLLLCDLCDKRQQDLNDPGRKEKIILALASLRRTVPLLNSSMQAFVKYPTNVQTKASRDYTCKQVSDAVSLILEAVDQHTVQVSDTQSIPAEKPGLFAHSIETLIEMLSPDHRIKLGGDFEGILEQTVRHGMSVAAASRESIKDDIIAECKHILQLRSDVTKTHTAMEDNASYSQLLADFGALCEELARDLLTLESLVKSSITHQIVDVFTETTEPMDRLVKTATVRLKEKGPIKEELCTKLLQPLDDDFHDHSDRVLQLAAFIAASCIDRNRGQEVLGIMANMEELDSDAFPSCLAVRQNLSNKGAMQHLKLVRREWHSSVNQLLDVVDSLIDSHKFIEVSESCLEDDIEECRQASLINDPDLLSEAANHILGRCKRLLHVARQHQNKSSDAVYRNGLQVFIGQVENAIPLVKNGAHYVVGTIRNKRAISALLDHARHLLQCIHNLHQGLDPANQPSILSPLRLAGRSARGRGAVVEDTADIEELLVEAAPELSPVKPISTKPRSRLDPSDEDYLSKSVKHLSFLESTPSFHLHGNAVSTPLAASHLHQTKGLLERSPIHLGRNSKPLPPKKITRDMIQKLEMAYPMNELVRALFAKQRDQVKSYCEETKHKVDCYPPLIQRMKKLKLDASKIGSIESKVMSLQQLTCDLIDQFDKSLHGDDSDKADAVIRAEKWNGHMTELVKELRDLIGWWMELSGKASHASKTSDMTKLQSELDHVATLKGNITNLISVAIGLKEILQTLEGEDTPTHLMHIQQIQSKASDWTKLTSALHSLGSGILIDAGDRSLLDRLEYLNLDWAVSGLELLATFDRVVLGQRSPDFDAMAEAMRSGQEAPMLEEVRRLNVKGKELREQSNKAIIGCFDVGKQINLTQALKDLDLSTNSLATAAISMVTISQGQMSSDVEFRLHRVSLLHREWLVKTQLVECLIDSLVIEMLIPLDRLTGAALAARQAQGPSRQQIMEEFQAQADGLSQAVTKIRQDCTMLLQGVSNLPERDTIFECVDTLARITPSVLSKMRQMADGSSASSNSDVTNQKREWACYTNALISAINSLPGVDFAIKQEMTRSLLQDKSPTPPGANASLLNTSFPTPHMAGMGQPAFFSPPTIPQLTPEQWRLLQTLPQQGVPVIQTPPGGGSPYFHGNHPHHMSSGMTTPIRNMTTPRIVEPSSASPRQQGASVHDLSPGRLRSLHHSFHSSHDQVDAGERKVATSKKKSAQTETDLGTAGTPRSLKMKSASTSSLLSVNSNGVSESGSVQYSNSITAAALALQQETDRWEEDKNEIIKVARVMAGQMGLLAKYARRHSCIEDKRDLISTAKAIAANGAVIVKFADIIAKNSVDHRFAEELRAESQHIPSLSTQLNILASVKAATPDDLTSNAMLVKNAENLMGAVVKTLKAAEAACVKGLQSSDGGEPNSDADEQEAKALAMQWKRKLHRHRLIEASSEDTDHLGLRKIKKNISAPSLTEIVMK